MKKIIIGLIATAALAAATAKDAPLDAYLDETVDLHVSFRSPAETRAAWDTHPLGELAADSQVSEFIGPLFGDTDEAEEESFTEVLENEFGLSWDELFELLPGQITASLYNLPELMLEEVERPELVIMAEFAGDAERLTELMQVQFERNASQHKAMNPAVEHVLLEETFMGETLYLDETFDGEQTYIEDGYALVDGVFVLATPETRLRSAVEAIKVGPEDALVETIPYQRARGEGGRGDLSLYLNLTSSLPPLNDALMEQSMAGGAAMLGLSSKSLDAALSLRSMQAFFMDVDLVDAGLSALGGLIYREKAGLLSLLTYEDAPLPPAEYVPADIYSSSVSTMDLGAMLARLEAILAGASPNLAPMIDMQMQNVRSQTGVDLRSSVLENFTDPMVSLAALPDDQRGAAALVQPEQVVVVGVRDAQALSGALEALLDLVPGAKDQIEVQRFAGQTIQTIRGRPDPNMPEMRVNDVSYVITRSQFIFNTGDTSLLKEVLTRMESGGDGFWQSSATEALFEPIAKPRAVTRSYANLETIAQSVVHMLKQTEGLGLSDGQLSLGDVPEDLALPFHVVSEMNEAEDGFFTRVRLIKKGDAE